MKETHTKPPQRRPELLQPQCPQQLHHLGPFVAAAFLVCVCVFNGGSVDLRTLPRNFAAKLKKD